MAHKQNFIMAILMVVLLFSTGIHKTEADPECIGPCLGLGGFISCRVACEKRGYKNFDCNIVDHVAKCCCTN
ncbi:hypothetical protein TSUD_02970 [Trifolium subterraneum]|uniref:Knottin scorpion toxin-like domain-containing protein n=1 Tax=Trifolium subterraneum TaxID=3900 RepID=A0A2Z6M2S7_TRISU|nr:hypothetical protein TSUD_02970 [Trifolium subterraneum]